jgi:hypothetical protein
VNPLFTSIPSEFNRQSKDGNDIGREYAIKCIQSWRNSGFDPISINAENEPMPQVIIDGKIKQVRLRRDATHEYGKPLINLDDFISTVCRTTDGPVALTNADILIRLQTSDRDLIENLDGHVLGVHFDASTERRGNPMCWGGERADDAGTQRP